MTWRAMFARPSALVALLGTALALVVGGGVGGGDASIIEGFTAGGFIYIACGQLGRGVIENKHLTSSCCCSASSSSLSPPPPPPQRVCMSINPEGKKCSDLGRTLVLMFSMTLQLGEMQAAAGAAGHRLRDDIAQVAAVCVGLAVCVAIHVSGGCDGGH